MREAGFFFAGVMVLALGALGGRGGFLDVKEGLQERSGGGALVVWGVVYR